MVLAKKLWVCTGLLAHLLISTGFDLNSDIIQNWPEERQKELLQTIKAAIPEEYEDITVVGSRVGNWFRSASDIDVVFWVKDDAFRPPYSFRFYYYDTPGWINKIRISEKDSFRYLQKYSMPRYSLITQEFYPGIEADIIAYTTERKKPLKKFISSLGEPTR